MSVRGGEAYFALRNAWAVVAHRMQFDESAAKDAEERVGAFITAHMK